MSISRRDILPDARETSEVFVDMGYWDSAAGDVELRVDGLGPCIGVMTHEPDTKLGHAGHLVTPQDGDEDWEAFLNAIQSNSEVMGKLAAWVRGGELLAIDSGYDRQMARDDRERVVERLTDLGIARANIDVKWSIPDPLGVGMVLKCADGAFSELLPSDEAYEDWYSRDISD